LTMVHDHGFGRNFVADRPASASAGISLAHAFSPVSGLVIAFGIVSVRRCVGLVLFVRKIRTGTGRRE
jgi:hypothetical protein